MDYKGIFYAVFSASNGLPKVDHFAKFSDGDVETFAPLSALSEAINGNGDCRRAFTSRGVNMRVLSMAHQDFAYRKIRNGIDGQPITKCEPVRSFNLACRMDIGTAPRDPQLILNSKDGRFGGQGYLVQLLRNRFRLGGIDGLL